MRRHIIFFQSVSTVTKSILHFSLHKLGRCHVYVERIWLSAPFVWWQLLYDCPGWLRILDWSLLNKCWKQLLECSICYCILSTLKNWKLLLHCRARIGRRHGLLEKCYKVNSRLRSVCVQWTCSLFTGDKKLGLSFSPVFGTKSHREYFYLWRYLNFLTAQCRIDGRKYLCPKPPRFV